MSFAKKKKGLNEIAVTTTLSPSLISDYTDHGNLQPRVTIRNEIYVLRNVNLFERIDVGNQSSEKYLASVELKYELSFTRDHLLCNNYQSFLSKDVTLVKMNYG